MNELTKARLALDDGVWDTKLLAQSWNVQNEFQGVNVVSDDDELCLLSFDEVGNGVDTSVELDGLGSSLLLFTLDTLGGLGPLSLAFGLGILGSVLLQKLEDTCSEGLVGSAVELVNCGRDLETLEQDSSLSLEADILGPLDVTSQVKFMWAGLSDSEDLGTSDEEVLVEGSLSLGLLWLLNTLGLLRGGLLLCGSGFLGSGGL